jgi:hypothetical protein
MPNETSSRIKTIKTASGVASLVSAIALLVAPAMSNAAGFTLDGVKDGVGGADSYSDTFQVKWFNGHKEDESSYMKGGAHVKADVHIGNEGDGMGGVLFSWLVLEVPLDAKNMVWGPSADPFLSEYDDGLSAGQMDFNKATGSEKVIFGTTDLAADGKDAEAGQIKLDLAKGDTTNNSPWTIVGWKDSTDYLLGAGSGECMSMNAATDCGASTRTMSFEVKFEALNLATLKTALVNNGAAFHLSPERNGAPDMSEVPVPAAFWLFGSALIGFIGFSRRTTLG